MKYMVVGIVGTTNSGKSTFINYVVGNDISIVTHKVQTTRYLIRGITTVGETQLVFADVPGLCNNSTKLEKVLNKLAFSSLRNAHVAMVMIDPKNFDLDQIERAICRINQLNMKYTIAINKCDIVPSEKINMIIGELNSRYSYDKLFVISSSTGAGINNGLLEYYSSIAPLGDWVYSEEQITDSSLEFITAEITRKHLFLNMHEEVPYSTTVVTEKIQEKTDKSFVIHQTIYVIKDSHKKMLVGAAGTAVKRISYASRMEISDVLSAPVSLFLFVKVHKSWQDSAEQYIASCIPN